MNFEAIDHDALKSLVSSFGITYPMVQAGNEPLIPFDPLKGCLRHSWFARKAGSLVALSDRWTVPGITGRPVPTWAVPSRGNRNFILHGNPVFHAAD